MSFAFGVPGPADGGGEMVFQSGHFRLKAGHMGYDKTLHQILTTHLGRRAPLVLSGMSAGESCSYSENSCAAPVNGGRGVS